MDNAINVAHYFHVGLRDYVVGKVTAVQVVSRDVCADRLERAEVDRG